MRFVMFLFFAFVGCESETKKQQAAQVPEAIAEAVYARIDDADMERAELSVERAGIAATDKQIETQDMRLLADWELSLKSLQSSVSPLRQGLQRLCDRTEKRVETLRDWENTKDDLFPVLAETYTELQAAICQPKYTHPFAKSFVHPSII